MSVTSVRQSLDIVGKSASIRQLIRLRNEQSSEPDLVFPVSLREFVGALPPGRVFRKFISLGLLRRKLNEFFNNPARRPLFKMRLHNLSTGDHRHSTVDVLFDDPADGYISKMPDRKPHDLGQLEIPIPLSFDPDFHFSDFNSERMSVKLIIFPAVDIEITIRFEVQGTEIIVNNSPNIDFDGFNITVTLSLGLDSESHKVDLVGWLTEIDKAMDNPKTIRAASFNTPAELEGTLRGKTFRGTGVTTEVAKDNIRSAMAKEFIHVNASVNVGVGVPDGFAAGEIEGAVRSRLLATLKKDEIRSALSKKITPWLVGGDYRVLSVSSDERELVIQYMVPPGQLEPFPEKPQPALEPGRLSNIDHIVVLMMENRSFDMMLGYLTKDLKRDDVDGLRGSEKNRFKNRDFPSFPLTSTVFPKGPCHEHNCVEDQVNGGNMGGFVTDYAKKHKGVDPGQVMGHYTAAQVPIYDFLAKEFLICQRWFSSHPGPTFPNRFYTLTGRLNRFANEKFERDNPHGADLVPSSSRTIFDHLSEHAVSWRYYENEYCFLRMFEPYTTDDEFIVDARHPTKGFFASAANGTLPSVSFIDPDFIDKPPGNDDGPPADITDGQRLVREVVKAVMAGPKWEKTLLLITYDEHGGFYDHVKPEQGALVSLFKEYGVRVPAFVVSPWVDRGKVSDVVFDHTSIAKTIARRFMSATPPDMGARMAEANDLSSVLRSTPRTDITSALPRLPPPKPGSAFKLVQEDDDDDQDFKTILRSFRARHPRRK